MKLFASKLRKHDILPEHAARVLDVVHVGDFRGKDGVSTLVGAYACVTLQVEVPQGLEHAAESFREVRTWFRGDEKLAVIRPKRLKEAVQDMLDPDNGEQR